MPVGSTNAPEVANDYQIMVSNLRKIDANVVIGSPINEELAILERAAEVRKLEPDALVVLSLHGFTGHLQALFIESVKTPTIIWTLPTRYSLPTSASAIGYLRERGIKVKLVHGPPSDYGVIKSIEDFIKVAFTYKRLGNLRIGSVGGIIPPMVASHYDRTILKDRLGVDVVRIPLNELTKYFNEVSDEEILSRLEDVKSRFRLEAPEEGLKKALKLYLAIRKIQEARKLDAIALECYTELFQVFGVNPCVGFIDDQVIGCEGEVLNTIGLLIAKYLSGKSAMISDPYSVSDDGIITFMHCAAPATVAEDTHKVHIVQSEPPSIIRTRIPVIHCRPEIPLTTVTIFRIYGKNIDKIHVTAGSVIGYDIRGALQVRVRVDNPKAFLENIVGNHYVIAFGDIRERLKLLSDWLNIKYIET